MTPADPRVQFEMQTWEKDLSSHFQGQIEINSVLTQNPYTGF